MENIDNSKVLGIDTRSYYRASNCFCKVAKDDYMEGEDPSTEIFFDHPAVGIGTTPKEAVRKLLNNVSSGLFDPDEVYAFDNELMADGLCDRDYAYLTEGEINAWKEGKNDNVYAINVRFRMEKVEVLDHDELVEMGFQSYD